MNQTITTYRAKLLNLFEFFESGDKRTLVAKKNIFASFFIKGFGIILTFIQVPLLIDYLDTTKYGIWLTISSMVQWFWFFDIGLSNGLRNKFAEAILEGNNSKAKSLVSTTYFILSVIGIGLIIVFIPIIFLINWSKILNVKYLLNEELELVICIVFVFFVLRLMLQPISSLLLGAQKTAINDMILPLSNLLLIVLLLLTQLIHKNSFLLASLILSISPIIIYLVFSIIFYQNEFKAFIPELKSIYLNYTKPLFNLGILFFLVQISGVILYSTTNFLIIQLLSPVDVTKYNIVYKYFSSILFFYSIVINPFWSSFTEAYTLKDYKWIIKTIRKLKKISLWLIIILLIMLLFSDMFYNIWIGDSLKINFTLSVSVAIFFGITIFNMVYCYFLNGIGKIKEQAIMSIIAASLHIPLSIFFVKFIGMGIEGIIFSLIILSLPGLFIWPYLYKQEIKKS